MASSRLAARTYSEDSPDPVRPAVPDRRTEIRGRHPCNFSAVFAIMDSQQYSVRYVPFVVPRAKVCGVQESCLLHRGMCGRPTGTHSGTLRGAAKPFFCRTQSTRLQSSGVAHGEEGDNARKGEYRARQSYVRLRHSARSTVRAPHVGEPLTAEIPGGLDRATFVVAHLRWYAVYG